MQARIGAIQKIVFVSFLVLWGQGAHSIIRVEDAIFPELATSGRALSMGNAFVSRTDDSAAAFYNPAGLGSVRGGHFHLSNFHLEVNKGLIGGTTGGKATDAAGNLSKGLSLDGMREILVENPGELVHERIQVVPNVLFRYFSAGYLYAKKLRATLDTEPNSLLEFHERTDQGPYAALNISLFGGIIKGGVTGIYLNRKEAIQDVDPSVAIDLQDSDYQEGRAWLFIQGARLTLPIVFLPTFSIVAHNVAETEFTASSGSTAPAAVRKNIVYGFSLTPQLFKFIRVHLEVNLKDATKEDERITSARKVGAGLEIDFDRRFFLRAGYGDGWGSFGIGVRTKKMKIDLNSHAVDTTSSAFLGKEDRRFSISISQGIGW